MIHINTAWALSGAAARAISLFRQAQVAMERGEEPEVIIGNSSGALAAPILAVAFERPEILPKAIEFAETLDTADMFPYKGNKPFGKKGKPTVGAIFRALGHNHLGWQDIKPLYKRVFTEEYFQVFKRLHIKCYAFGVVGEDWSPVTYCLNDAETLDEMIDMIECSSRIVPFVQPMEYKGKGHVDGGYIAFNPGWTLFSKYRMNTLVCMYSREIKPSMGVNPEWDKNVISITTQAMNGMAYWHGNKDKLLNELYCYKYKTNYIGLEAPDGYTDEIYETDDAQLIALGDATYKKAEETWNNHLS